MAIDIVQCLLHTHRNKYTHRHTNANVNNQRFQSHNTRRKVLLLFAIVFALFAMCCVTVALSEAASISASSGKTQRAIKSSSNGHHNAKGINSPVKIISIKRATNSIKSSSSSTQPQEHKQPSVAAQVGAHLISVAANSLLDSMTATRDTTSTQTTLDTKVSKRKPSKIYNLPVKFVANGKPTSLVSSLMQQHLASIKKGNAGSTKTGIKSGKGGAKRKGHVTGSNSKLIYLGLKYMSNAKPYAVKTRH